MRSATAFLLVAAGRRMKACSTSTFTIAPSKHHLNGKASPLPGADGRARIMRTEPPGKS